MEESQQKFIAESHQAFLEEFQEDFLKDFYSNSSMPAGVPPKFSSPNIALESHLEMPREFSAGIT